jgi:methylglutaconyl-CoA hydratase
MAHEPYVIRTTTETGVATLTLNEPQARNPLSPNLVHELTEHLREIITEAEVRAVVIVGAGKGFSSGADLRRMRSAKPLEDRDEYNSILDLNRTLWRYPKPTIAAVHGFAMGAGANLMSWCDIAVADAEARIGYPEVKAGVPSATVIPSLMRAVPRKRMYELVLTGATISAAEALDAGLISRVAPAGSAYDTALDIARAISEHHPSAVALTKEIIHVTTDMPYDQAIIYAKDLRVIARLRDDFKVEISQGSSADSEALA